MDIANIYRNIGKILRNYGASKIYIVKSKTLNHETDIKLSLEIIADWIQDCTRAADEIHKKYPNVHCTLYNGDDPDCYDLLQEAEEDGIQL